MFPFYTPWRYKMGILARNELIKQNVETLQLFYCDLVLKKQANLSFLKNS